MRSHLQDWVDPDSPLETYDLTEAGAISSVLAYYGLSDQQVLPAVMQYAYDGDASTALVETRYVDSDYRDEHSTYWSTTFRRYPSVAHRMHFFADDIETVRDAASRPFGFGDLTYLGYTVLRPVRSAPVGRTMLPLLELEDDPTLVTCLSVDSVNVNGSDLHVTAMPFYSQDAQLTRCGQAAIMATGYYHHLTFGNQHLHPSHIAQAVATSSTEVGRPIPSTGITVGQFAMGMTAMDLAPLVIPVGAKSENDRDSIICRYLNSRLPVTIYCSAHAFVLVGYKRTTGTNGEPKIVYLRHDDEVGPYQWVDLEAWDIYGTWEYILVPVPPKMYLLGEEAEPHGKSHLVDRMERRVAEDRPGSELDAALLDEWLDETQGTLSLRSTCMLSNDYKRTVRKRGLPDDLCTLYQATPMSRYIWVVELTRKTTRDAGRPCVLAEVILDATDHPRDTQPLAWRTPSTFARRLPDTAYEQIWSTNVEEPALAVHSVVTHAPPHLDHP